MKKNISKVVPVLCMAAAAAFLLAGCMTPPPQEHHGHGRERRGGPDRTGAEERPAPGPDSYEQAGSGPVLFSE